MSIQSAQRVMTDTQEYVDIKGGRRLEGEIRVSGAKNSCLPIMAASLLTKGRCHLDNVPRLRDVDTLIEVLRSLGANVEWTRTNSLSIDSTYVSRLEPDVNHVRKMRASVLVLGPLLTRFGHTVMPLPGGCSLGKRPIDIHLAGMAALGALVEDNHENVTVRLQAGNKLKGTTISLRIPSVGATENIMMAATLADGTTTIENAAKEPEISDLAGFLGSMGARIIGAGEDVITVIGVNELRPARHTIIPDRIEAATYMIATAITGGKVVLNNVRPDHMESTIDALRLSGCTITTETGRLRIDAPDVIRPLDIRTMSYPGFSTDVQPPFMALMAKASGESLFVEKIFERRFLLADELKLMGADIRVIENCALVNGGRKLTGCEVNAPDIRAAAGLVVAALWADGTTRIKGLNHLYRGYEMLVEKLRAIGVDIFESARPAASRSEASLA